MSVLLAVGDEDMRQTIIAAQERAALTGLDYLERNECFARRGVDGVNVIPAGGFVGAAYTHEMARSGDPHLHTHVVVANRVLAADGRWTAPDMRPVYAAAKTAGTIAEAELRKELSQSLGVRWRQVVNGTADIKGVPNAVLEHFSRRHTEIAELALARGWTSERGIAAIQRETRDHKPHLDRELVRADWRARASERGFSSPELGAALEQAPVHRTERERDQLVAHLAGPTGLTRQQSTFDRRAVIQGIVAAYPEGISAVELGGAADRFIEARGIPVSSRDGHRPERYTTHDMLVCEARLIDVASARAADVPVVPRSDVQRVIASSPTLGEDQADAVHHLTSGAARTRLLEARAGYGKTTTLRAVREAYDATGVPIVGTAWQGQAAQTLQQEAGIPARTAASLIEARDRGGSSIPPRAVLVIDEAGTMPTRALASLYEEVARQNGRMILVGDRDQLPSIDAGGAFASLADRLGSAQLLENRRQRDELQRAVAGQLADGNAPDALALLSEHGRFQAYDDARQARDELIEQWAETSLQKPATALILAHDRYEVAQLNQLARERLDDAGQLGKTRLLAHGNEWAVGDRLLCRHNDYRPDLDVRNGTRATVTGVHRAQQTLTIRTDDGRAVRLPADYLEHVEHGYASTGHVSQGATVDRTYLLATPERGGREWGYVAGSRHRIDLRVYAVHQEMSKAQHELERTWTRSQAKVLALDMMHEEDRNLALRNVGRRFHDIGDRTREDRAREEDRSRDSRERDDELGRSL